MYLGKHSNKIKTNWNHWQEYTYIHKHNNNKQEILHSQAQNNWKKNCKQKLKDILKNEKLNYEAQATATFSISAPISEILAVKDKKC